MNDVTGAEKQNGNWEQVDGTKPKLLRMSVPGGWLVTVSGGASYPVSFYPDPEHAWNPSTKNWRRIDVVELLLWMQAVTVFSERTKWVALKEAR
jgi:hypothetical protein